MKELEELLNEIEEFTKERDWDQFHSPKNLSMALSVEVSELLEIFQWMESDQSYELEDEKLLQLKEEIADSFIYLLMLSSKFEIDPIQAAAEKLEGNRDKYPINKSKGSSKKYTDL
jgi:NTP pyrophosphatase (non-canonical NTP hydrolase)